MKYGFPFPTAGNDEHPISLYRSNAPSGYFGTKQKIELGQIPVWRPRLTREPSVPRFALPSPDFTLEHECAPRCSEPHRRKRKESRSGDGFPRGPRFAATRAGSARKGQGGRISESGEPVPSAARGFVASPRRRRPRLRRRGEAEPPSGGRADPVAAGRSRRAWPGPARVERAGHGSAARRERLPGEGSRHRILPPAVGMAHALSVGFQRPHAAVGAGASRTRVRLRTATARFGCCAAG